MEGRRKKFNRILMNGLATQKEASRGGLITQDKLNYNKPKTKRGVQR